MQKIAILGSTGSIGKNCLIAAKHLGKENIQVVALAARSNIDLLEQQALEFAPQVVAVYDLEKARELQQRIAPIPVIGGMEGLKAVATYSSASLIISSMSGAIGLSPTLAAIQAGKKIGFANKEVLVAGGELVISLARKHGIELIPIDSELTAIFQCLKGEHEKAVKRILITASGGPFRNFTNEQLQNATVDHALNHPNYSMGQKVTIDSSTLMNKGLEMIEAHWLFQIPIEQIEIIVHPQQIIHGMVEFIDGSLLAHMCDPDMLIPIQYALTHPNRSLGTLAPFDFLKNSCLQFFSPDRNKFRCLQLAYDALRMGGSMPCYMNGANEVLVHRFLNREISWLEISKKLENLMTKHKKASISSLEDILNVDQMARREAKMA